MLRTINSLKYVLITYSKYTKSLRAFKYVWTNTSHYQKKYDPLMIPGMPADIGILADKGVSFIWDTNPKRTLTGRWVKKATQIIRHALHRS